MRSPLRVINEALCTDAARLLVALILVGGIVAAVLSGKLDPVVLASLASAAVGFYYGGQTRGPGA